MLRWGTREGKIAVKRVSCRPGNSQWRICTARARRACGSGRCARHRRLPVLVDELGEFLRAQMTALGTAREEGKRCHGERALGTVVEGENQVAAARILAYRADRSIGDDLCPLGVDLQPPHAVDCRIRALLHRHVAFPQVQPGAAENRVLEHEDLPRQRALSVNRHDVVVAPLHDAVVHKPAFAAVTGAGGARSDGGIAFADRAVPVRACRFVSAGRPVAGDVSYLHGCSFVHWVPCVVMSHMIGSARRRTAGA